MNAKLQRDAGMYPARYEGEGRWPHHPDFPDMYPAPFDRESTGDDTISFTPVTGTYEVAYLRGGENAVLTLHLFDLVQRGYLEILETKKWLRTERRLAAASDHPPHDILTEAEQNLVDRFTIPRQASETFHFSLPEPLRSACSGYQARFEEAGLLRPQAVAKGLWPAFRAFFAAVVRLTASGKARLKELEAQFDHLKGRPKAAQLGIADPALLTAVGVFDIGILAGSAYDAFAGAVGPMAGNGWSLGFDAGGDGCGGCGCGCGGCGA